MANVVDYEIMAEAKSVYDQQVANLEEVVQTMVSTNDYLLQGWQNNTSLAFVEKFDEVHKVALNNLIDAINDLSRYIAEYSQARQDEDAAGSASIRGW